MRPSLRQLNPIPRDGFPTLWWGLLLLVLAGLYPAAVRGQTRQWEKALGGSGLDRLSGLEQTPDGGYIVGGSSRPASSSDKSQPGRGGLDYRVLKLDASGNKAWDQTLGGSGQDQLSALRQTSDGGYILGGYSASFSGGDKTGACRGENSPFGLCPFDYWVVKLDAAGNKQWDQTFGGSGADILTCLEQTSDGGYILGGYSASPPGGDKSASTRGAYDFWVVKLDAAGNKVWDRSLGGSRDDHLTWLEQTRDGGFILGGDSYSGVSGDRTQPSRGAYDYWVVKLDAAGNKTWDRALGGSGIDQLTVLRQTSDGGYIAAGSSQSNNNGDKSEGNREDCAEGVADEFFCSCDYWVVKLDSAGNRLWDKTLGGSGWDRLTSLQQTRDGGFILGGYSNSPISGDKAQQSQAGSDDYWLVKLDAAGNKQWDKTFGGPDHDFLYALDQTRDGGYILGGNTFAATEDDKNRQPHIWLVKLAGTPLPPQLLSCSPSRGLPGTGVSLRGMNLLTTTALRFQGQEADFEVVSDEEVRTWVPAQAVSGPITLETAGGQGQSPSFTVLQPEIAAFIPFAGRPGSKVYLVGRRLSTATAVYFNGVRTSRVKVYFDGAIAALVPAGAATGRLRVVLAGGGTAASRTDFTVLPPASPPPPPPALAREAAQPVGAPGAMAAFRVEAFPNPFHQQVSIRFLVPQPQPVEVLVWDVLGRQVQVLYRGQVRARQAYQLEWRPAAGLPAGLYLIRLQAADRVIQTKVLLAR